MKTDHHFTMFPRITIETYRFLRGNKALHLASGRIVDSRPLKAMAKRTWVKTTILK